MPALLPALPPTSLAGALMSREDVGSNNSISGLNVVCAWPLSSQYGPGSRVLYYVLVAACVFARKLDWLRNACVGLALLVPVVAALHGVVLAAVHVEGAVDMDIYGAFQLCAIGVLAAPVAVKQSSTYFNDPGRNTIFIWVLVLLSGLISLAIEFYRANTTVCKRDDNNNPIDSIARFPYEHLAITRCGLLHCSPDSGEGPFSPIRGGSADNIYIIPAPDKLTLNTATLLAAACCIPAILLLVSMWFKILEFIWKSSTPNEEDSTAAEQDGTVEDDTVVLGAAQTSLQHSPRCKTSETAEYMEGNSDQLEEQRATETAKPNRIANAIREYGEIVIFGAAVLIILILGERNMFSSQITYQQEPLGNIGQWSPIAGTILGILGSAYLLLVEAMKEERRCPGGTSVIRMTARLSISFGDGFGNIARKIFDDGEFRRGRATGYPETPGEEYLNPALPDTRSNYSPSLRRDSSGSGSGRSALSRQRSPPAEPSNTRVAKRRDTLEVPTPGQRGSLQGSLSRCVSETGITIARTETPSTPAIVVSPSPVYAGSKSRRHTTESAIRYAKPGASASEPG